MKDADACIIAGGVRHDRQSGRIRADTRATNPVPDQRGFAESAPCRGFRAKIGPCDRGEIAECPMAKQSVPITPAVLDWALSESGLSRIEAAARLNVDEETLDA